MDGFFIQLNWSNINIACMFRFVCMSHWYIHITHTHTQAIGYMAFIYRFRSLFSRPNIQWWCWWWWYRVQNDWTILVPEKKRSIQIHTYYLFVCFWIKKMIHATNFFFVLFSISCLDIQKKNVHVLCSHSIVVVVFFLTIIIIII